MAKKEVEPAEYPITVDEFIGGARQVEMAAAFRSLMKGEGQMLRDEWQRLYELFQTKPVDMPWVEWIQKKGGN